MNPLTSTILEELTRAGVQISDKLRAELETRIDSRLMSWLRDENLRPDSDGPITDEPSQSQSEQQVPNGSRDSQNGYAPFISTAASDSFFQRRAFDTTRLRVGLMCDTYLPFSNGVTHMVALLARTLAAWGHEPHIFTFAAPGAFRASLHDHEGIEVHHAPGMPILDSGYHFAMRYPLRMKWLLREMDVLHVHHPFISGRLAWRLKRPDQPLLFTNHTRYDIYGHYVQRVVPFVSEEVVRERLIYRTARFANRCDYVISPSASVAEVLRQWGVLSPVETIPNGISLERFQKAHRDSSPTTRSAFRKRFGWFDNAKVLVYLGRLVPEKNIETLLKAFSLVRQSAPEARLLLIGEGPLKDDLRIVARGLQLGNTVRFAGAMPYDEVPAALAACDLFTSASVSEVHPLTFLEAMASGLAAVGTRSPGVADTLRDDQVCTNGGTQDNAQGTAPNGWLCEATPTALSACMVKALSDEEERKRRAEQAVRDSSAYSIEMTTRCTVDLYRLALTARMPSL